MRRTGRGDVLAKRGSNRIDGHESAVFSVQKVSRQSHRNDRSNSQNELLHGFLQGAKEVDGSLVIDGRASKNSQLRTELLDVGLHFGLHLGLPHQNAVEREKEAEAASDWEPRKNPSKNATKETRPLLPSRPEPIPGGIHQGFGGGEVSPTSVAGHRV